MTAGAEPASLINLSANGGTDVPHGMRGVGAGSPRSTARPQRIAEALPAAELALTDEDLAAIK
ncbi:MAG: hypothetical protein ACRDQA_11835 [Nocardioidaceae bacterium]